MVAGVSIDIKEVRSFALPDEGLQPAFATSHHTATIHEDAYKIAKRRGGNGWLKSQNDKNFN